MPDHPGHIPPICPPGTASDPVLDRMARKGIPITRESYIAMCYPGPQMPKRWLPEHEADLPPELILLIVTFGLWSFARQQVKADERPIKREIENDMRRWGMLQPPPPIKEEDSREGAIMRCPPHIRDALK
jgi:hypothetical protein